MNPITTVRYLEGLKNRKERLKKGIDALNSMRKRLKCAKETWVELKNGFNTEGSSFVDFPVVCIWQRTFCLFFFY